MIHRFTVVLAFTLAACAAASAGAQVIGARSRIARPQSNEAAASAAFDRARAAGPLALHAFLEKMPKGADLHMHLSGAVYAETFLKDAADDRLCVDPARDTLVKDVTPTLCPDGDLPAATAFKDQKLYDALVDAFSMRAFIPSSGVSGHDHFFTAFDHFGALSARHDSEWLDEVADRAARQNEQYLEVMVTPSTALSSAITLGNKFPWPTPLVPETLAATSIPTPPDGASRAQLATLRDQYIAAGIRTEAAAERAELDSALAGRQKIERCGTATASPGCNVEVRVLYQVLRAFPPQVVFAQALLAFEVASADPDHVVGLNFVQPEDSYLAMSEYHRQMLMLDYLHSVYPRVHISLHAGELAPGLVPPIGLTFHIREAVELGHAERIGHGVDAMYEDQGLLDLLAVGHVMVEINLTSNAVILGVTAPDHPLPNFIAAHVPVALSTDDEGVSRIDLTHEYTLAALEFHLSYAELKKMARTSLEHSFLPGESLWKSPDDFTAVAPACAALLRGSADAISQPGPCSDLLRSPKAREQWDLERRFDLFEAAATHHEINSY